MSGDTPTPSASVEESPVSLRRAVPAARRDRMQERRRDTLTSRREERVNQETERNGNRRFQKRYKVAKGPAKRRHVRRFCRGFIRHPRGNGTVRRQPRGQENQRGTVSRVLSVMSEEEIINVRNTVISYITSLTTLSRVLQSRVKESIAAIEQAARAPAAAAPQLAAAAHAQAAALDRAFGLIQEIDDSGICELEV